MNPDNDLDLQVYGGSLRVVDSDWMGTPILECDKCGHKIKCSYSSLMGRGPKCNRCSSKKKKKKEE